MKATRCLMAALLAVIIAVPIAAFQAQATEPPDDAGDVAAATVEAQAAPEAPAGESGATSAGTDAAAEASQPSEPGTVAGGDAAQGGASSSSATGQGGQGEATVEEDPAAVDPEDAGKPENTARKAATRAAVNDIFTSVTITDSSGNPLTSVGDGTDIQLNFEFTLPNGQVSAGDTTTIELPSELKALRNETFTVTNPSGDVIANVIVDAATKTVTMTYTNYVDTHSDISGKMHIVTRVDTTVVTEDKTVPVTLTINGSQVYHVGDLPYHGDVVNPTPSDPDNPFAKGSWIESDDGTTVMYSLRINTNGSTLHNVVVTDELLSDGLTYDPDTQFYIRKGAWSYVDGQWKQPTNEYVTSQYTVNYGSNNRSFTINLGDIDTGFYIVYAAKVNHQPLNGERFYNQATMTSNETDSVTRNASTHYQSSGGSAEGYNFTINIHKVDPDGNSLAGAEFEVVRDASGGVVGTITTDSTGSGSLGGLLRDNYTIRETKAPDGYDLTNQTVQVTASEFNEDREVFKEIENTRTNPPIEISGTKTWDDGDNQDGIRPGSIVVTLYGNDQQVQQQTVTPDADGNWTYTFTGIYQNDDSGNPISYRVEEEPVSGYSTESTTNETGGADFTNTHQPETVDIAGSKTWDDADDQDGARPNSITIRLLADGTEVASKTVTADDGWTWSFTGMPKYNAGSEITYSITEDAVDDYTPGYDGYNVTNAHTPGKTSVTVVKSWDDADNQDGMRPDSVTVRLLADGADTGKSIELNEDNGWQGVFTDLDEYANGQKVVYTVAEDPVSQYEVTVSGDAGTGFSLVNTHTPETVDIAGKKVWDDDDNATGARPEGITIRLLADGAEVASKTVTADDGWAWSFTGLPKYKGGVEIAYSITEDAVEGYTSEISGDAANGFTVTNTLVPTPPTPKKTTTTTTTTTTSALPRTGDGSDTGAIAVIAVVALGVAAGAWAVARRRRAGE